MVTIEHANISAYLCSSALYAPRLLRSDLVDYLTTLSSDTQSIIHTPKLFDSVLASRDSLKLMQDLATAGLKQIPEKPVKPEKFVVLQSPVVEQILSELHSLLFAYPLFVMGIGFEGDEPNTNVLPTDILNHSVILGSVTVPNLVNRNVELIDPAPVMSMALRSAPKGPGFIFWTPNGEKSFVFPEEVDKFCALLRRAL